MGRIVRSMGHATLSIAVLAGCENSSEPALVGEVTGSVVLVAEDQTVEPFAGVSVNLQRSDRTLVAVTDSAGEFEFRNVAAGTWLAGVLPPAGFETVPGDSTQRSVDVHVAITSTVPPFRLRAVPTTGRVTVTVLEYMTSIRIQGALITLDTGEQLVTGGRGQAEFLNVEPGTRSVTITPPQGWQLHPSDSATLGVVVEAGRLSTRFWTLRRSS